MARQPKPWYRTDRRVWCVTIDGKRHNLGREKKAAFARFRELLRSPSPRREPVTVTSLVEVVDEFLDWVYRNRAAATFEWYRGRLQSFVEAHPELTVERLKPYHVEQWAGDLDRAVTTRRNRMRSVKRCLKWAVAQGHLERSPIAHMEVPSGEQRDTFVPQDDFDRLLTFVHDQDFADLLRVTYETGCRPQESLRVEARHVDLRQSRWVFPMRESKGRAMPRIVYLSETATRITKRLMAATPSGALFRNRAGRRWSKDAIGCAFDRVQVRMGKAELERRGEEIDPTALHDFAKGLAAEHRVGGKLVRKSPQTLQSEALRKLIQRRAREVAPRYCLYALRHSWATNALQRGVDALTVAILMGHKDPSTLARTYQHLSHNPDHLLAQAHRAVAEVPPPCDEAQ